MTHSIQYITRVVATECVEAKDVEAWSALESRAIEPNAYLSPHFVLAATRWLTPDERAKVFFVEKVARESVELVGVGVFSESGPTKQLPIRTLAGYRSRHSFLSGLLLDREWAVPALRALLDSVSDVLPQCKAVVIPSVWNDGALATASEADAQAFEHKPRISNLVPRAILIPSEVEALLSDKALASRIRDLDRRQRRLRDKGKVSWRCLQGESLSADVVEHFLALEHMGWKGESGTSLRSLPQDESFFRDMVAGFASEGRVIFTELTLDDVPIASTCNLVSGRAGFAFKIGWDPKYRSASPAFINELELIRHAKACFAEIDCFDSGASPTSYINALWTTRRTLATLSIPTGALGAHALRLASLASQVRRRAYSPSESIAALHASRPELVSLAEQGLFALEQLAVL